ncbi:Leucine Rich Repeat family protein [Tritrichomonas foetus]|uniref:Leucine Rich Repeat family protein n=1 Tax=Tritrichomonas foetus TaxID=1144522 RepID=A0A1J4KZX5_9EUKA|nr:Leucine Rich Repeat family protein [Tritrichomonas foetus]|eukprot:OHT16706.1 Leucine Rich Repeat family protein [Tritrichomonas foetus]
MSEKSKQGILNELMIFQKTRTQNLLDVRTLNMWGYELEDVTILSKLTNAETISLPINKIRTLAPFQTCRSLKNLLLRQNNISDLNEIEYLADLPNLRNLTLADNPIASIPGYRETVISAIPQLEKLDDIEVTSLPPPRQQKYARNNDHKQNDNYQQNNGSNEKYRNNYNNNDMYGNNYNNNHNNSGNSYSSNNSNNNAPVKKQFNILDKIDYPSNNNVDNNRNNNNRPSTRNNQQMPRNPNVPSSSLDEHLLTAVLSLIPELSVESLQIVLEAIRDRCGK